MATSVLGVVTSPKPKIIQTGLLGCDYRIENGRYRFSRIYDGENWNPDLKAPLTQPGVNVQEGEYLLAVNGREVRATDNVFSFFEATAGKSVRLRVGPNADGAGARDVTVVPVPNEGPAAQPRLDRGQSPQGGRGDERADRLRLYARHVVRRTRNFTRYYYAQVGKEAVIIDERFNGGGALATDIIEHLKRTMMSLVATRDGEDEVQPQGAIFGPKVMIINQIRRLWWRRHAQLLSPRRRRQADWQAHLGWPGRARRSAAADGWRFRHRSELRSLGSGRRVGC